MPVMIDEERREEAVRPRLAEDAGEVLLVQPAELLDLARRERVRAHDGHPAQVLLGLVGQARQLLLDGDGLGVRAGVVAAGHADEQRVRSERRQGQPRVDAEHDDQGPRVDDRRVDEGQEAEPDEHRDALEVVGRARHEVPGPPGLVEAGLEPEEGVEEVRADRRTRPAAPPRAGRGATPCGPAPGRGRARRPGGRRSRPSRGSRLDRPAPPRASTTSLVTHGMRRAQALVASRRRTPAAYRARCRARYRPRDGHRHRREYTGRPEGEQRDERPVIRSAA